jgi:hypothetical protein
MKNRNTIQKNTVPKMSAKECLMSPLDKNLDNPDLWLNFSKRTATKSLIKAAFKIFAKSHPKSSITRAPTKAGSKLIIFSPVDFNGSRNNSLGSISLLLTFFGEHSFLEKSQTFPIVFLLNSFFKQIQTAKMILTCHSDPAFGGGRI